MFTTIREQTVNKGSLKLLASEIAAGLDDERELPGAIRNPKNVARIFSQAIDLKRPDWLYLSYSLGADAKNVFRELNNIPNSATYMARIMDQNPALAKDESVGHQLLTRAVKDKQAGFVMDIVSRGYGSVDLIRAAAMEEGNFPNMFLLHAKEQCTSTELLECAIKAGSVTALFTAAQILNPTQDPNSEIEGKILKALDKGYGSENLLAFSVRRPTSIDNVVKILKGRDDAPALLAAFEIGNKTSSYPQTVTEAFKASISLKDVADAALASHNSDVVFDLVEEHGAPVELYDELKSVKGAEEAYFADFEMSEENQALFKKVFPDYEPQWLDQEKESNQKTNVTDNAKSDVGAYEQRERPIETDPSPPRMRV